LEQQELHTTFLFKNGTFIVGKWNVKSGTKSQLSERFYKRFQDVYEEENSLSEAIRKTIQQLKNEATDREA
jgi:hypothetical protein